MLKTPGHTAVAKILGLHKLFFPCFLTYILHKHSQNKYLFILIYTSDRINGTKIAPFFLSQTSTHHSFTFNMRFLYEQKHKICLSKAVCGIFYIRFRFILLKFMFLCNKKHRLFDFKMS